MDEQVGGPSWREVTYYRWRREYGGLKANQAKRLKEFETENAGRCRCVDEVRRNLGVSECRACAALGQQRSTQRRTSRDRDDVERLTEDIIAFAHEFVRYGCRKICDLQRRAVWIVNDKRVERIWRREGLKVPANQPKSRRLWLGDGSCIRLRAEHRNHRWSYEFVEDRTHDARNYRMLNIFDVL